MVDVASDDLNPATTIFCVRNNDHKNLIENVTAKTLMVKYWSLEIMTKFRNSTNGYIIKRKERKPDLRY